MERERKLELIERSLGLRHKLKVHESMEAPQTHEELSMMLLAKWELEDELRAIEEILADARLQNVEDTKDLIHEAISGDRGIKTAMKEKAADSKNVEL